MKTPTITPGMVAAGKEFKKSMQEVVDKSGGMTSISISTDQGKTYHTIAEKQSLKTSQMNKIETLNLKCILTDEEMMAISKEMSEHINKKKQAEDDLASFSAQKKADIKGHDAIINKSAMLINAGSEYRNIKCEVIIEEKKDTVSWIRSDTGEIAQQERPIPKRYLQKELDLNE